jgi:nicotinate-nucleotide adenylyltransferase
MRHINYPLGPWTRFGILGGTFNPIHIGHLSIAQQVRSALRLERVFLMPAAQPPHKRAQADLAPAADRLELCRLAVRDMDGLAVSALELQRGGVSYTVETLLELRAAYGPRAEIRLIIGSDTLAELHTWRDIGELLKLTDWAVADRREEPLKDKLWAQVRARLGAAAEEKLRGSVVPVERVDVSSTLIRKLLRDGEKVSGYLRRDVEDYIRRKGLYGAPPAPTRRPRLVRN